MAIFKEKVKTISPGEEKEEEVVAPGFAPFVPCINGCIGTSTMGEKDVRTAAGFDPQAASLLSWRRRS
jgi:hypothetical protein